MKTQKFVVATVVALMIGNAQAALFDRGGGMVYDDALNITWLQDANYAQTSGYDSDGRMSWTLANTWAANLGYGGFDDWRLPTPLNQDGSGPCGGSNCTNSEMGHMFYNNMGASAGNSILTGENTANLTLFANLQVGNYWTGTAHSDFIAWDFRNHSGHQGYYMRGEDFYAWAVRNGDVAAPIPEPETYAMMLAGLGVMGGIARRRQSKR